MNNHNFSAAKYYFMDTIFIPAFGWLGKRGVYSKFGNELGIFTFIYIYLG